MSDLSSWSTPREVLPAGGQWSELDAGGARAPCVLESDDGTALLWYSGSDGTTERIMAAKRSSDGCWSRCGRVVDPGTSGASDAEWVTSPSVVRTADGYVMVYAGSDGSAISLHLAVSPDGMHWNTRGKVEPRGEPERVDATDPCLVVGNQWWLFYGSSCGGRGARIDAAVSRNGASWVWARSVLEPHRGELAVLAPSVVVAYASYHMFYVSNVGHRTEIQLATSSDGLNWGRRGTTMTGASAARGRVRDPCVVRAGGTIRLWYSAPSSTPPAASDRLWSVETERASL